MSTPTAIYLNIGPYLEVISGISTVFSFSDGVVKLTGPLGAGKTALLKELVKELRSEEFEVVLFHNPPKSMEELQATLIRQFRLGADVSFRKALIRYLSAKPRDMQKLILVIDDADQMSVEALAGLHTLRTGDSNNQIAISLMLCGDKNLNAMLAQPELATLAGEITLNYSLNPLDEADISEFCTTYLQQSGKGKVLLSYQYLEGLLKQSRGLPGLLLETLTNDLQDPAFLLMNTRVEAPPEPKAPVVGNVITNITEQINNIPPETKRWLKPTFNGLLVVAAASTAYVYYPRMLSIYQDMTGSAKPGDETAPVADNKPAETVAPAPAVTAPAPQQVATTPAPQQAATPPAPVQTQTPAPTAPAVAPAPAVVTTTPSPAPAAPRQATSVATPAPALPPVVASSASDLTAAVNDWIAAWQRQDTQAYFANYHTDFASLYHDTRASWRADRTRSLTKPAKIALSISDFEVAGTDATGTTVRFWLNYQSPSYADRTRKELVLGKDVDGKLRILRELNREVEVQTVDRLPASSVAAAPGQPQPAAPAIATATPIGEPILIQPNAAVNPPANGRTSLNQFVASWLNAWQHKDLNGYFEHYSPDFKNALNTTEAWREDRTVKITRPAVIQLQLDNMELVKESSGETVLKLTVTYHSSYYADRTQKELHLQLNQNGGLQIVEEKNLAVETLPLSRLLPSVQVAMQELAHSLAVNHF